MKNSPLPRFTLLSVIALSLLCCCSQTNSSAYTAEDLPIKKDPSDIWGNEAWLEHLFINLDSVNLTKPIFISFSTEWCTGCKQVDKWYFQDSAVLSQLSERYHLIKIDGDTTQITMQGKTYGHSREQKARHELILAYAEKWFGYPNILIFDENLDFLLQYRSDMFMAMASERFIPRLDSPQICGNHL